ncbi:MAG: LruC domain-containing protein [Bacteroidetes bacterium]|jgi:LruC domain-containing protein|nr:LruC domain-containing protein [Bacteroidota bacterium]
MKTLKIFTILLIAGLLITACNRSSDDIINPDEDPIIESVNDLVVPADFDWKTHQTIDVIVTLPQSGELKPLLITNRDGSKRYFRGFPEDGSRTLRTKITLPTYEYELRLIYSGANGPNMAFISNGQMIYDFVSSQKSVTVVGCDLSNFTTYSKGGWGQNASGNNVGALRDQYFDQVYPNDFVIGDPDNFTITFESAADVENYLPGGGDPAVLNSDWVNPLKKDKLGNMADQIIAARLNRDYNAAGFLGVNATYDLGELVFLDGPFANTTVNDFLTMAETALGGGDMLGFTASVWSSAAESIINSFHEGTDGGILTCPQDPEEDDPYIEITATCIEGDVIFTISNIGDGDMTSNYSGTLIKNDTEIENFSYQLDVNETYQVTSTGLDTDVFEINVDSPQGETLIVTINGCGEEEDETTEQLGGTLAYEDLWPGKGDYDFNDLVIDYDFDITKNDEEIVQSITATFVVKAFGASYHNGFGFTFPTVEPSDIVSVTGYDVVNSSVFNISGNGLENGQSKATIIVFDDARRVMPQTTGGIGVNTQLEYDFIDPVTLVVEIVFADNAITYSELNIGTFNPFLIVNTMINGVPGERGLEIHLPNYETSDLFDEQYLGQFEDDSSIAEDRYFVTENNLPWAINIAEPFDWVIEFQDITGAYNVFAEWAQSGGINYPDWYQDETGYRNNSLIYPTQIGN